MQELAEWLREKRMRGEQRMYYPELEEVRTWLADAHLPVRHEAQGDGYQHYIAERG